MAPAPRRERFLSRGEGPLTHWHGEPVAVWEGLLEVPRFEAWGAVGSTNDRVAELAREGAPPFTTVVADAQRSGRGRGGRSWASPPGKGLWMSVLLPASPGEARLLVPLVVGLAVARSIEALCPSIRARVKWPNDVVLVPEGARAHPRKVCGILCEGVGTDVVAGIGVNVAQLPSDFDPEIRSRAVSLAMAVGEAPPHGRLAREILGQLRSALARPTFRLEGAFAGELRSRDALLGRRVRVTGGPEGIARGVDHTGALLVEVGVGDLRRVMAGSVHLADEAE